MSNTLSVGSLRPYVVTPEGHAAALADVSCNCRWHVEPGMLVCELCGTAVPLKRSDSVWKGASHGK